MSIVVTCASGGFGRRVAAALDGREGVVLADAEPYRLHGLKAEVRHGDLADPPSLAAAFAGAEAVLLPAAGPERIAAAIEAARGAAVERIVLLSSIDPRPGNPAPWAEADRTAEAMARASGLGWTILRLQEWLEDFADIGRRQQAGGRMFTNRGTGLSAPVALDDAAAAVAEALAGGGHGARVYELTGPALVGSADLARALGIGDVAHKDAKYLDQLLTEGVARTQALEQVALGRAVREGYYAVASGDVETLAGRKPRGLEAALET